jgi:outer membrane lipoprotein carrier protein
MLKRRILTIMVLIALAAANPLPAAAAGGGYNKAMDILMAAKVQAYYARIKDFKAKFKQVYTKAYHGKQRPRYGYLWVKKPGLMRWRYDSPQKRLFVCDGRKVWIYTPGDKQVLWRRVQLSKLPSAVKFLWGSGNLLNEFKVKILTRSKYRKKGTVVLKLKPVKATSHYAHILFVLKPEGPIARVLETLVYDALGNNNHYIFSNREINTRIRKSRFQFTPPRGVRVIEATKGRQLKP